MSAVATFDDLLRRLGHQHELEVRTLREQVVQLQKEARRQQSPMMLERTKDETTASTVDPLIEDDKGCLPPTMQICHPVHISMPDSDVPINGIGEVVEAPDPDALEAAFQVALESPMDESHDLDDMFKEIAVKVAHDRIQEHPAVGSKHGVGEFFNSPLPAPQTYAQPQVNVKGSNWWDQQGQLCGDIDQLSDQVAGHQAKRCSTSRQVGKVSSKAISIRETTATQLSRTSAGSLVLRDGNAAEALKKFEQLEPPVTAMGRWERLIDYATTVEFLDGLPSINQSWTDAAKEDVSPANKSMLRMHNFKSFVLKNNSNGDGKTKDGRSDKEQKPRPNLLIRTMLPLMMHPTCRRRVVWDIGGITLLLHDVIFIPIQQAFEQGTQGLGKGYEDFLSILDLFGASFWTLDICVSFLTGYYSNEGFVELGPVKVARHYLRSWFPMDLMIVTVDWCTMFIGMSAASGYMRLGKTVSRIMRVLRLLRFLKMNTTMRELMERINSEYVLQLVNLMKTLIVIVIVNHYIACVWYGVGAATFARSRWTEKFLVNYPKSFPYAYATALHWSLTQFTPASMEVVPQNAVERFFTIFVIINALVAFSSFVSSITAAMTHIRNINARQVQEEASIRQFFSEHKISHGTASRVWHFVRQRKGTNSKRMKESDVVALKHLPPKIKEDLRLEIYLPILRDHAFFSELHTRDKGVLIKICNLAISEKTLNIGEELFWDCKHKIPAMIFVSMGTLVYLPVQEHEEEASKNEDEDETFDYQVNRQQWACESALWADRAIIHGSFMAAIGSVELLLIDAEKAGNVLKASSTCVLFAAKYADLFMNAFRDHSCISNYNADAEVNLLFNDHASAHKWVQVAKEQLGENQLRSSLGRAFPFLGYQASSNF